MLDCRYRREWRCTGGRQRGAKNQKRSLEDTEKLQPLNTYIYKTHTHAHTHTHTHVHTHTHTQLYWKIKPIYTNIPTYILYIYKHTHTNTHTHNSLSITLSLALSHPLTLSLSLSPSLGQPQSPLPWTSYPLKYSRPSAFLLPFVLLSVLLSMLLSHLRTSWYIDYLLSSPHLFLNTELLTACYIYFVSSPELSSWSIIWKYMLSNRSTAEYKASSSFLSENTPLSSIWKYIRSNLSTAS